MSINWKEIRPRMDQKSWLAEFEFGPTATWRFGSAPIWQSGHSSPFQLQTSTPKQSLRTEIPAPIQV